MESALRRRWLLALAATPLATLGACGGRSGDPPPPDAPDLPGGYRVLDAFPVSNHAALALPDGSVLVTGGSRMEPTLSAAIDRFDPATERFTRIGTLRGPREQHRATLLANGQVMISGGLLALPGSPSVEIVDPVSGAVTTPGQPQTNRKSHAALRLADASVLGGHDHGGQWLDKSPSADRFDPATGTFRRLAAAMHMPRGHHTATLLPDGRVLIIGGYAPGDDYLFAEMFDPVSETFTPLSAPQARPRALHSAVLRPDGSVWVIGGEHPSWATGNPRQVLRFDPSTDRFTELAPLALGRSQGQVALGPNGELRLFGGFAPNPRTTSASAEAYDSSGGRPLDAMPQPRAWHTVTTLPGGRALILGGESPGQMPAQALVYE
jgi:hypothetical protein